MPLKSTAGNHGEPVKGRGAPSNPEGRFEKWNRDAVDDGWLPDPEEESSRPKTVIAIERAKSVISRHDSPDLGFSQSINPYRGCSHGCIFCFARPSHAYLGLSPGLDFETRLSAKTNAAEILREEISKPGYKCEPLTIGVNTDAYQPIEREYRITRSILELCYETKHPVSLITKGAMIERDIDLLAPMAKENLASATLSVTTLDAGIMRYMEPRASAPARRLLAIERLSQAGIPVQVNVAPVIPFLTDSELEPILEAAKERGATSAGYILLRLPWEVKDMFREWLQVHFPLKADHVMSRVHVMRGGKDNDPRFGTRMTGEGLFADLLRQRFEKACARLGLGGAHHGGHRLDTTKFVRPGAKGQGTLF
ncbi:radical SAM protein [Betaproteobacteria bacterium GR16-43]|nr:radical SAM protein [Betaproteobacteria bacterium GR16-43]